MTMITLAGGGEQIDQPWTLGADYPPQKLGEAIGFQRLTPRLRKQLEDAERVIFGALNELGVLS
jgi:hypothetical protein